MVTEGSSDSAHLDLFWTRTTPTVCYEIYLNDWTSVLLLNQECYRTQSSFEVNLQE